MKQREPAEVFHPGEYLRDELEARSWSDEAFSQLTGITIEALRNVLEGKSGLLGWMAERIGNALGTSATFWIRLNHIYYSRYPHKRKAA